METLYFFIGLAVCVGLWFFNEKFLANKHQEDIQDCDLFKAGHHGSYTASTEELLSVVKPKNSVVTCVCGSTEYTKNNDNTFCWSN